MSDMTSAQLLIKQYEPYAIVLETLHLTADLKDNNYHSAYERLKTARKYHNANVYMSIFVAALDAFLYSDRCRIVKILADKYYAVDTDKWDFWGKALITEIGE